MDIGALFTAVRPPSESARRALDVAQEWIPDVVVAHSLRSWILADLLGATIGPYDRDVLFVAAVLHDIALAEPFDAHRSDFEIAGGAIASVFAVGAGWSAARAQRVAVTIEAHMYDVDVDPQALPEGFLLAAATAADVSGRDLEQWDRSVLANLEHELPRHGFAECFAASIADQAARKPRSAAAGLHDSGRITRGDDRWRDI